MKLSIVTTSFQSASTIVDFVERIHNVAKNLHVSYELIIVDDGSTDSSKSEVIRLLENHNSMTLIELSRNFGHHQAILLGLEHALGEYIFLIDSDLEEAPELLKVFFDEIQESNVDVVYGVSRKAGLSTHNNLLSNVFWKLFRNYTKLSIPKGLCTVRIMKREYVKSLLLHNEVNVFLAGLWEITGFNQKPMNITRSYKGSTNYTFGRKLDLALTSLISFSGRPLRLIAGFGTLMVALAILMLLGLIMRSIFLEDTSQGWLSIIAVVVLIGGLQILSIGMVAIYVASILEEVKARPRAIISKIWSKEK